MMGRWAPSLVILPFTTSTDTTNAATCVGPLLNSKQRTHVTHYPAGQRPAQHVEAARHANRMMRTLLLRKCEHETASATGRRYPSTLNVLGRPSVTRQSNLP